MIFDPDPVHEVTETTCKSIEQDKLPWLTDISGGAVMRIEPGTLLFSCP